MLLAVFHGTMPAMTVFRILRCHFCQTLGLLLTVAFSAAFSRAVSAQPTAELVRISPTSYRVVDSRTEVPVEVIVRSFYIAPTEVTQAQFEEIMGYNPSHYRGPLRPVETVSWWDAIRYCNLLSLKEGLEPAYDLATGRCDFTRNGYRLPTEAEWRIALGELTEQQGVNLGELANLGPRETKETATLRARIDEGTVEVGSFPPNQQRLYDMIGNVWEWCHDFNDPEADSPGIFVDPQGPSSGVARVMMGGSFITNERQWNRGFRGSMKPDHRSRYTGFRVVRRDHEPDAPSRNKPPEWWNTFQDAPPTVKGSTGNLTSLLDKGDSTIDERIEWEKERENLLKKWESIIGETNLSPIQPQARTVQVLQEPYYTGHLVELQVEPDRWEKIYLMFPDTNLKKPRPVVIVPYYDVDVPAGKNLGGRVSRPASVRSFAYLAVRYGYIAVAVRWWGESYGENYNEAVANLTLRHPQWTGMGKWVWDIKRVLDYLSVLPEIDNERFGIIGHSLGAKLSLYAAAFDERISTVVFSEGGIGFSFSNYEDYWYLGERLQSVPEGTDQHELLGLIAPRPFLLIGGDSADNDESWHYINAARPVYSLYGGDNAIGYFNHRSGHSPTPESVSHAMDWLRHYLGDPF
ncbi:MAG TPA: SUMF1/EgtB/PvdO family nonheme iron enzyme [Acidobacteriota bacterium]|nr:SUMF1/EgtB/PvdO family nonheme iron enzyme [Acidobacteriota bacterium]